MLNIIDDLDILEKYGTNYLKCNDKVFYHQLYDDKYYIQDGLKSIEINKEDFINTINQKISNYLDLYEVSLDR